MNKDIIQKRIEESIQLKTDILHDVNLISVTEQVSQMLIETFEKGGGVYLCGNGGSAADAQHIAAELSGRFLMDRMALKSEALHVNSSFLTAVSNDWSYDQAYARAVEAFCSSGDVVIGLSTSGNSANVVNALEKAKHLGCKTIGMTGENRLPVECDLNLIVPSGNTARIQEAHILLGHIICELVEIGLFK
jgi:D-sedoheptulose 7-phosphate isomerase